MLPKQYIQPFTDVLANLVQSASSNRRDVAVQCLESLLTRTEVRKVVWSNPKIILGYLFRLSLLFVLYQQPIIAFTTY